VLNKGPEYKGLTFAARLSDTLSGRMMEVYTDQPGLQFYTGNFLDGSVTGKKGCKYKKYVALTLETQKFPDSPNHPFYPSTVLLPGEIYQHHTVLKFKTVNEGRTYTNPIIDYGLADPNIKYENGYYYLLATGKAPDGRFIPIYRSKDLIKWDFVRGAVERGNIADWNYKNFWAPEVYKINGKFYLYYTASPQESPKNSGNRVGLAICDSIQGPYKNVGVVVPHASIDGHVFTDKDGSRYIFYTIENMNKDGLRAGQIYADKLLSPTKVAGKPVQIISNHNWQEGPFILHRNNIYFLTYSCGAWTDSTYHVRYAIAKSPLGPYAEQPDTILKTNKGVKGPGHHSFFTDRKGKDWIVYHGWDPAHTTRYSRIDRIFINGDHITSDGPTYTSQPINK
jgi:beta-xylosidase